MGLSAHTWVITRDAPKAVSARMRNPLPHNARRAWPVMEPDFFGSRTIFVLSEWGRQTIATGWAEGLPPGDLGNPNRQAKSWH
jgi:hypothetical protein